MLSRLNRAKEDFPTIGNIDIITSSAGVVIAENHVIRKAGIAIDVDTAAKTQLYRCVIRNGDRAFILNRQEALPPSGKCQNRCCSGW